MTKVIRGTKETEFLLHGREAWFAINNGFFFEGELENTFKPVNVNQIERESSVTGDVGSLGSVSFCKPQQLLCLAQTTPGKLSFK